MIPPPARPAAPARARSGASGSTKCKPTSASGRTASSTCRRWRVIPPTTCRARQASASRRRRNSSTDYGDLDTLLQCAREIKQPKRRETLTDPEVVERIRISKKLVTLVDDVALETPLDDLTLAAPDAKQLIAFFKAMEFTTLVRRAADIYSIDANVIEPDSALIGPGGWRARDGSAVEAPREPAPEPAAPAPKSDALGPSALAAARGLQALETTVDRAGYVTLTALADIEAWAQAATRAGVVAIDTETSSLDPMTADLVGRFHGAGAWARLLYPVGP